MNPPDEPSQRAARAVLTSALLTARMIGWRGTSTGMSAEQSEKLADLMDAVHNIPELLGRWQLCDESLLVHMLRVYDEKWGMSLAGEYERVRGGAG